MGELLNQNHKTQDLDLETDLLQTITTMPTQDSSLAMELLMPVLLEQLLELLANMLQTRSSTPVQEVVPGSKIQTTEFLVEILVTFFLELSQDLLGLQLQTLLLEVHVEDKISYHNIICTISKTSLPIHFVLQAVSCNKQSSDTIVHILDSILYKFDFLTK